MKNLAIFDLDGTLLDTIADLANSANYALEQCGYPTHSVERYRYFVGNGIDKLLERALPEMEQRHDALLRVRPFFLDYYNRHNADLTRPYPGIGDLLGKLQNCGIRLGVASNKYQEATGKLIAQYFPDIRFAAVYGMREGFPAKPDPRIVMEIIGTVGAAKDDTVYIGDSCVDMETGRNAGVTTVGVSWGFRPRNELEEYKPALIADNVQEILQFLTEGEVPGIS